MVSPTEFLISAEEERALHKRLVDHEVTAFENLARIFLDSLIAWLVEINSTSISKSFCIEAAEDALIALVKSPHSFDPARKKRLAEYLRMSAQGDLRNILKREDRHRKKCLGGVELSSISGKYLAVYDDPSDSLRFREESEKITKAVITPARDGLTEAESRVLDLILGRERKTAVFAKVLGIEHLPIKVQRVEVKRVKDKLKKRIERETKGDAEAS